VTGTLLDAVLEPLRSGDIQVALGINMLLAWSLWLTVVTGQLSLGHSAFMAVGAYAASVCTVKWALPLAVALPAGALLAGLAGAVFGFPALRLRGLYLAIASIGFVFLVAVAVENWPWLGGRLGLSGMMGAEAPLVWAVAAATAVLVALLERSRLMLAMRAVRESEAAAAAIGIDVTAIRLIGFSLGAALAGLAGGLWAHYIIFIEPRHFDIVRSFDIVLYVVLGGTGVWWGPALGAAAMTLLPVWVRPLADWREVAFAVALIYVMGARPQGLATGAWLRRLRIAPRGRRTAASPAVPAPAALPERGAALLAVEGVGKRFGGLQALSGVSFAVGAGEILGIIGPNGAGKSTLFNCITGTIRPDQGSIVLSGRAIAGQRADRVARLGVGRTFQNGGLFAGFTARENVVAGQHIAAGRGLAAALPRWAAAGAAAREAEVDGLLAAVGLADRAAAIAGTLAYGEQRRLEIARALAGRPSLLLLDEPAAGMVEHEVAELAVLLRRLAAGGLTIVVVEHNVGFVTGLCDRMVALEGGTVIAAGPPLAVVRDPGVVASYLGTAA
jgi:branched-chain amino acid transport system permease protein